MSFLGDVGLTGITLLRPWWLLALLPASAILWHVCRSGQRRGGAWAHVVDAHLLPHLLENEDPGRRRAELIPLAIAVAVAILAMSGPALPGSTHVAMRSDATRVLIADLSPALNARPATPPRVDVLQVKLLDLLTRMPEGQTALLAYAEEPYLLAPATTDAATLRILVPELSPDILPLQGARPERALRMAHELLARSGASARDVLWLTAEGEASAATLQAVDDLRGAGVRVSLLRLSPQDGNSDATPSLHGAILASGGLDLAVRQDDTDVGALVRNLARDSKLRLERTAVTSTPRDLGPWLLPLLLPISALAFRHGILVVLAFALLLPVAPAEALELPRWWPGADRRAMQMLNAGDAEGAAKQFSDPRWQAVAHYRAGHYAQAATLLEPFNDADSLYNRGNALAHLKYLDDALQAYEAALHLRPDDPDILHNRDLLRKLMQPPPPAQSSGAGNGSAPRAQQPNSSSSTSRNAPRSEHEQEAERLAQQWLRRVPDEPAGLLRRKLELEHRRRLSGESPRPW